jgi:transcription-repair coupling factor (superfamily II helicase)
MLVFCSLITTPPAERRPIVTHLLEFQPDLVKSAVNFELTRGGQVFYVVPRVKGWLPSELPA